MSEVEVQIPPKKIKKQRRRQKWNFKCQGISVQDPIRTTDFTPRSLSRLAQLSYPQNLVIITTIIDTLNDNDRKIKMLIYGAKLREPICINDAMMMTKILVMRSSLIFIIAVIAIVI